MKFDNFRRLNENESQMTALGMETNVCFLWRHMWRACFHGLLETCNLLGLFEDFSIVYWRKWMKTSTSLGKIHKYSHTSSNHTSLNFFQSWKWSVKHQLSVEVFVAWTQIPAVPLTQYSARSFQKRNAWSKDDMP